MIKKLIIIKIAMAFPLNVVVFANGKKAITTNRKTTNCLINLVTISTGVVNR